ncbi:hypothetical protein DKX38_001157 [Salix brachista]|uniref:t-SNARE coiled-coil homology domain-containing protein n=1 Tax=Salix brachista TaxID=2182728 RepID=A0A5N5P4W0_9ROSI|nr:hypothetical protein DKX38_001157 [Salix brachista]
MDPLSSISEEIVQINGQVADIFRALSKGFQNLERIKDVNRQSRQLEELTGKMRECRRLIKEFDREVKDMESRNDPDTNKMLNEKKQSMAGFDLSRTKELNSYVALKKQYATNLENNKRVDLFDGPNEELHDNNMLLASYKIYTIFTAMTNQQIMDHGNQMMDETDQAIERGKKVVQDTVNVGRETAVALKAQTEQMSRIVNELDSIHFSIKKASKMVKEIGRQVATDKCIMGLLFLIVIGVIAIIIVKLSPVDPKMLGSLLGNGPYKLVEVCLNKTNLTLNLSPALQLEQPGLQNSSSGAYPVCFPEEFTSFNSKISREQSIE